MWFDSWESIEHVALKALICFGALILFLRFSGKRTLTKMNAFDMVMTISLGSVLASTITSDSVVVSEGLTALAALILIQFIIAWLEVRSEWFQKIIKAQPSILFLDGDFKEKIMLTERISKVEVLAAMRYSGLADPSQAQAVLLETDGQMSVIPKKGNENMPLSVLKPVESFAPKEK